MHARNAVVVAVAAAALFAAGDVQMSADQQAPIPPVNDAAEPVQHDQGLLQAACRPPVGIDERGRHRQGRQVDLGRRALRRNSCLDRGDEHDSERPDLSEIRHQRHARQGVRRRPADLPARHSRRSRRQRLGHRWPGQRAASGARRGRWRRRPAAAQRQVARQPVRRGAGACGRRAPPPPPRANPAATKGHQVFKFSPDGKLLMTLGKPGGGTSPSTSSSRTT